MKSLKSINISSIISRYNVTIELQSILDLRYTSDNTILSRKSTLALNDSYNRVSSSERESVIGVHERRSFFRGLWLIDARF